MSYRIVASNSLYQFVTRIVTSSVVLGITIFIGRVFGADGYGIFTKITAYVGLFYLFLDFGMNAMFLQKEFSFAHFRSLLYFRLLIAGALFVLAVFVAFVLPYDSDTMVGFSPVVKSGIFLFSFTFFTNACLLTASAYFQKELRYDLLMKATIIGAMATIVSIPLLFLLQPSLLMVVLALAIGAFATFIAILRFTKLQILPFTIEKSYIKEILASSWPLGAMLIFNLVYFRADIVILTFLKSTTDVGIYGFAYRFFDFFIAVPLFISNALYPFLLRHRKNPRIYGSLIRKYSLIFVAVSVVIVTVSFSLSPFLSAVKPEFALSILPFRILLISLPVFFLTNLFQWVLITEKKQRFLMAAYFLSAVINIVANMLFIPHFSYIASAIITGVCEAVVLFLLITKLYTLRKNFIL